MAVKIFPPTHQLARVIHHDGDPDVRVPRTETRQEGLDTCRTPAAHMSVFSFFGWGAGKILIKP